MSIDKEIVKMDKSNAVVIGLTVDGSKIYTDYFDEIVEELCYHSLCKDYTSNKEPNPAKSIEFVFENLAEIITKSACVITKKKMIEIIERGADDLGKQFKERCFGETETEEENAEQQ